MDHLIICPNCGETNAADVPFCQHCQWRLRPLDDEWRSDTSTGLPGGPDAKSSAADAEGAVPDWLKDARAQSQSSQSAGTQPDQESPRAGRLPSSDDLLAGLARQEEPEEDEIPEWVARIMGISKSGKPVESQGSDARAESDEGAVSQPAAPREIAAAGQDEDGPLFPEAGTNDAADGLSGRMGPFGAVAGNERASDEDGEINKWLRRLDATAAAGEGSQPGLEPRGSGDVPSWVDDMMGVPDKAPNGSASPEVALPDWLAASASADEASMSGSLGAATPRAPQGSRMAQVPRTPHSATGDASVRASTSPGTPPARRQEVVPPFSPEEMHRIDVDAVLASMHMPDWLADVEPGRPPSPDEVPAATQGAELIPLANLPSWVQAMRPTESVTPAADRAAEARSEESGPLLGLQGVLPAIPDAAIPSSRPKPHSLKLEISELHRAHATVIEEILAAETQLLPLKRTSQFASQRILRWAISAVLLFGLGGMVFSGSSIFPLPAAVPNEGVAAIEVVQRLVPDAPVLAVFDYEPATVGEMEATAAPLMDHLLLLKHPRLAIVSTSPTGSALAERFISGILADRAYVRGTQYVNLGFLPGGLTGVQSFAQEPTSAIALGASSEPVWDSSVLLGTRRLSDFSAIIVLTESLENGRVWIEQTEKARGASPMIIVCSAQAGPMLLPYFQSGQVDGLIAGLNGAAGVERANNGLPGRVRRYWDAYSLGLYVAVLLITLGAIWFFWVGFRERRLEEA